MNSSNTTSSSNAVLWWSGWSNSYPIYLTLAFTVMQPVCVVLGIIGNFWIICVLLFSSKSVNITFTIKLYYWAIAVGDLLACLKHLLWNVMCITFALYSANRVYYCLSVLSGTSCVLIQIFGAISETLANYTVVGLTIERFIAVCLPLQAHTLLTPKWTVFILFVLNLPICAYFTVLIPFTVVVFPALQVPGLSCSSTSGALGTLYSFSLIVILCIVHAFAVLVLSLAIFVRLRHESHNRNTLSAASNTHHKSHTSGTAVTLTMIALAIVTVLSYGFNSVSNVINTLLYYIPGASTQFQTIIYQILFFFRLSTIIPHCVNFFIYLMFIPSFKRTAFCLQNIQSFKITSSTANWINEISNY